MDFLFDSMQTHAPLSEIVARFVFAALFGAIIGLDRELKDRPAGLRTHMMMALAAAVFTVLTLELFHEVRQLEQPVSADPIRIIQAVTAGVAFLGAGAIIRDRGRLRGLTTGAGMWLAGSVGVACGAGFFYIAAMAVVPAIIILSGLRLLERRLPTVDKDNAKNAKS